MTLHSSVIATKSVSASSVSEPLKRRNLKTMITLIRIEMYWMNTFVYWQIKSAVNTQKFHKSLMSVCSFQDNKLREPIQHPLRIKLCIYVFDNLIYGNMINFANIVFHICILIIR